MKFVSITMEEAMMEKPRTKRPFEDLKAFDLVGADDLLMDRDGLNIEGRVGDSRCQRASRDDGESNIDMLDYSFYSRRTVSWPEVRRAERHCLIDAVNEIIKQRPC